MNFFHYFHTILCKIVKFRLVKVKLACCKFALMKIHPECAILFRLMTLKLL